MREKSKKQFPLMAPAVDHPQAEELEWIGLILDSNPTITERVLQDLSRSRPCQPTGCQGMTAEQVLRSAIIEQMFEFTYQELAFHIADSLKRFLRIGLADKPFKRSALAKNIKMISGPTWEHINRVLLNWARDQAIEKGRQARIDCTVVESDIHHPTDSNLLYDSVRVFSRIMDRINGVWGRIEFQDHRSRAKRRLMGILNAKKKAQRILAYRDLLRVTDKTLGYAVQAIRHLESVADLGARAAALELKKYVHLARRVVDQTRRRVLQGQPVPAEEKVVSIFEPHTDVIVKDGRETFFGHKVCLCVGASQLIMDCLITEGNPADAALTMTMLDRQNEIYGRYPLKAALDGAFASRANLAAAKSCKIKDVCFAKKQGLNVLDMCRSQWVYNRLRRFQAGIESVISWIKRSFSFDRCTWKGWRSFGSYVWLSVVAANSRTLAKATA